MKKINNLIAMVLLLAAAACTQNLTTETPKAAADAQSVLPTQLFASLQTAPQTKSVIGALDAVAGTYPVSFGEDDWITVYGFEEDGEIKLDNENNITGYTFFAIYAPDEDHIGEAFKLTYSFASPDYADMDAAYEATDVILLMPDYPGEIKLGGATTANSTEVTGDVLAYAGKITRKEFDDFVVNWLEPAGEASQDRAIPLHIINSIVKVTIDGSDLTQDLNLDNINILSSSYGQLDLTKLTDVFNDMVYYAPKSEAGWTNISYNIGGGNVLKAGGAKAIYVGVVPGTYDDFSFMVAFEAGAIFCVAKREVTSTVTFDAGALYNITIKITDDFVKSRGIYYPMFNYNDAQYDIYDQPYGPALVKYNNANTFAIEGMLNAGVKAVLIPGDGEPSDYGSFKAGSIAVVSRGGITFSQKVINAYDAGAAGIIVTNNEAGPLYMSLDNVPDNKWIPALGAPLAIMEAFAADPNGTLTIGDINLLKGETYLNINGLNFPIGSTKTKALSYKQTITKFEEITAGFPEMVVIPDNDFTRVGSLTGKVAVLQFQPLDSPAMAVEAIAKGALALIVPYNYNEYNKIPNADCSASSAAIGDFCIVRTEGSLPAYLMYIR